MKPFRRSIRGLLIYPAFQLKLLAANFLIMAAISAFVAFLVHRSFVDLVSQGAAARLPAGNPYFAFMVYQEKLVMTYLACGLGISVLLSSVAILFLSHKVAGPIVRMKGFLTGVAESGEVPRLAFRKGDFFSDLPETVNAAFEAAKHSKAA